MQFWELQVCSDLWFTPLPLEAVRPSFSKDERCALIAIAAPVQEKKRAQCLHKIHYTRRDNTVKLSPQTSHVQIVVAGLCTQMLRRCSVCPWFVLIKSEAKYTYRGNEWRSNKSKISKAAPRLRRSFIPTCVQGWDCEENFPTCGKSTVGLKKRRGRTVVTVSTICALLSVGSCFRAWPANVWKKGVRKGRLYILVSD